MFKLSVGTLALLAAPAGQQQEAPAPPLEGVAGEGGGGSHASAADSTAVPPQGTPASLPHSDEQANGGGGAGPTAAQQRALSALSVTVRAQLELLGDLSRAVGHAETALVCASLLRDAAGATATLGYGVFLCGLCRKFLKLFTRWFVTKCFVSHSAGCVSYLNVSCLPQVNTPLGFFPLRCSIAAWLE